MMFDATFHNISVISWLSALLVEETGENHRPATSLTNFISRNVVAVFELTTLVVIGTVCTGSCKSNYHTITTTKIPLQFKITLIHI
jgi:hypothetical protein